MLAVVGVLVVPVLPTHIFTVGLCTDLNRTKLKKKLRRYAANCEFWKWQPVRSGSTSKCPPKFTIAE